MGNACFFKNVNCCSNKNIVSNLSKSDKILTKDISPNEESKEKEKELDTKNENSNNKFNSILNYFNTEEKEILADYYKQRDKEKMMTRNKDNKNLESTVKRLLEQQTLKKVGPKRRETIRNKGDKILHIVKQIIHENKDEAMRTTNTKDKESDEPTLLINNSNKKGRLSQNIDKNILMKNKVKKKNINIVKEES